MHNCPINCLFATEALPGFGTISQSVSRRGDAHLFFPRPSSLSRPPSSFPQPRVYVLRQRAAVSSPSFGWEMESSSAKSHRRGPHRDWKEVVWRGGEGVGCFVTMTTSSNWSKGDQSIQSCCCFFFNLFCLFFQWVRTGSDAVMRQLWGTPVCRGKLLYAEIQFKRLA